MHRLKQAQLGIYMYLKLLSSLSFSIHSSTTCMLSAYCHMSSMVVKLINNRTSGPNLEIMPLCTAKWTCFFSLQRDGCNCVTESWVNIVWKNLFAVLIFSTRCFRPKEKPCKSLWTSNTLHLYAKYELARSFTNLAFLPSEFVADVQDLTHMLASFLQYKRVIYWSISGSPVHSTYLRHFRYLH